MNVDPFMSLVGSFRTQLVRLTMSIPGGRTDLTAQNLYGQAKDAAREATDAAASYAKDAYENSGDTFRDGSQAIAKKVQENPLGSMLIAGGIGFALALLITRPPLCRRYFG